MAVQAPRLRRFALARPGAFRRLLNAWPCWRGTGARVTYIAADWSELRVRIPLNWRTRNYVGTTFGGSLYAACDPHFMFLLLHQLGPEYVVWDKAASIRFRRPGKGTLTATFRLPDGELDEIKRLLEHEAKLDRTYTVDVVDGDGVVHATVEKVVNVRKVS